MLHLLQRKYNESEAEMMNVTVSAKGWVVIPAELRKKYGIRPGSKLQFVDYGGVMSLIPGFEDPVHNGAGMLQAGPSLTDAMVEEHRRERRRESGKDE
ncbi:MAG: AbrB/MazE/SpoVT family DNA-binding domain-containing protein [Anaerolineales bacterium]